jgi:hypothetical protein
MKQFLVTFFTVVGASLIYRIYATGNEFCASILAPFSDVKEDMWERVYGFNPRNIFEACQSEKQALTMFAALVILGIIVTILTRTSHENERF